MTVSSTSSRVNYAGNGSTTSWAFAFQVNNSNDLTVIYTDTTGTQHTLSPSSYNVTGIGDPAGGTVTYPTSGSPIAANTTLTIQRIVSPTQPTSISNQGAMWPAIIEAAIDRIVMICQGFLDGISRALVVGPTDSGTLNPLPTAANRASRFLGFDPTGQPVAYQTMGVWRGTWATGVAYNVNDTVLDGAAGANTTNIYACAVAHTSGTWSTDLGNGLWVKAVDVATFTTAAATSATNAASSASSASTSATGASSSASSASSSASAASTSASAASTSASNAASSASSASTSATNAASSATAAAASANALSATSTTSNTPAVGSMTWTTQSGKSFGVGAYVMIASAGTPAVWAFGQVTAYSSTTLTVNVAVIGTASAKTDWNIWLAGAQGATGATGAAGASGNPTPNGRLTLTSATPVLTGAVTGAGTVYYALYNGNQVPIYDGSSTFVPTTFTELSNVLANSSTGKAGPAAVTTNSNYDLFVWSDTGTLRLTRGGAWNSDTARSSTTENDLQRINGIWTNKNAITNGPGANLGTYVGTIRTDGSSKANWQPGGIASGGTAALLAVWNAYNRVLVQGFIGDSTASWTYTTATWRSADNSTGMRASFLQGLQEDAFSAQYNITWANSNASTVNALGGIGYNSTSAFSGAAPFGGSLLNQSLSTLASYQTQQLGWGYMQALEYSIATGTTTWYGQGAAYQTGLIYQGKF